MTGDVEYFSFAFCHLYVLFVEMCLQIYCQINSIGLLVFLLLESVLYILGTTYLSDMCFTNIFSQSVVCLFILSKMSLEDKKLFILMSLVYQFSVLGEPTFGRFSKKSLLKQSFMNFLLYFL